MIDRIFQPFLLQISWNLIHGIGKDKKWQLFSNFFPGRVLGLSYAPLKFSKEKSLKEFLEFK